MLRKYSFLSLVILILSSSNLFAQYTENILQVDSKNRFYCKVNSLGYAQLYRSNPFAAISINQRIKAWERKRSNLKAQLRQSNQRASIQSRINEFNRMINNARSCRNSNNPINACLAFVDTPRKSHLTALPIIDGAECSGSNSPVVRLDMFDRSDNYVGSCTGTVVHQNIIITAAHCADSFVNKIEISNLNRQTLGISKTFYTNPNYFGSADYDLAVVRTSFKINTTLQTILKKNDMLPGEMSAIAGYGVDEDNNSGRLRAGFFSIYRYPDTTIEARFLPGSGSNSCYGDSGGPALVYRSTGWQLAGVVSNGDNSTCGVNGKPDLSRWCNITSDLNLQFLKQRAPELF